MSKSEHTTIVGISAEGAREDWSSEFILEPGAAKPLRRLSSAVTKISATAEDDPFSDGDFDVDVVKVGESASNCERVSGSRPNRSDNSDWYDSEDEEDWDRQLGISEEVREGQDWLADGFRLVVSETLGLGHGGILDELSAPAVSENETLPISIPNRCKIVSQLFQGHDDVNLVLYPKSIALFSLKLDNDRRQLMAMELDEWLRTIVTKHITRIESAMKLKNISWLNKIQAKEKGFSSRIVRSWSETITIMYRLQSRDILESLVKFSKLLRHFSRMDKGMLFQFCDLNEAEYALMFDHVLNILRITAIVDTTDLITGKYSKRGSRRAHFHFRISLTDVVGGTSPKSGKQGSQLLFAEMIRYAVVMFPEQVDSLALLELQAAAHHCAAMLENNVDMSWSPSPYAVFKAYLTLYRATAESASLASRSSLERYGSRSGDKLYRKSSGGIERGSSRRDREREKDRIRSRERSRERDRRRSHGHANSTVKDEKVEKFETAKISIICDMYLLLNGYVPLTVEHNHHLAAAIESISLDIGRGLVQEPDEIWNEDGRSVVSANTDDYSTESERSRDDGGSGGGSGGGRSGTEGRQREMKELDARVTNILRLFHVSRTSESSFEVVSAPGHVGDDESSPHTSPKKARAQSLSMTMSSRQSKRSIQQVYDVLADDGVGFFDIFHLLYSDMDVFKNIFTAKYRSISRKDLVKPKVAFALGSIILHNGGLDPSTAMEQAESIYLEAIVLLDKLYSSHAGEVSPPVISPFGIMLLEKFADLLMKNSKYKFGVSCLESVVAAHLVIKSGEEKRLYRRLTAVAQECGDIKRSLYYHCIMLRIAKEEAKLNEFVYISDLVSKLFLEVGEVRIAERCLRVVALLLTGCPLPFVDFEIVNTAKLKYHFLPVGLGIPTINLSRNFDTGGLWVKRMTPAGVNLTIDSQQLSAVTKLIDLYMFCNQYQMAIDLCQSLLKRKVVPQSRGNIFLSLAKCYLKLRQLAYCEATLDRMAFESEEIISSMSARNSTGSNTRDPAAMIGASPSKPAVANARFYRLMFDLKRDTATTRGQTYGKRSTTPYGRSVGGNSQTPSSGVGALNNPGGLALMGLVSRVRSYTYMILRAKCRLSADDPEWALYWLQIARAICPKGKYDRRGHIRFLNGKAYSKLCIRCRSCEDWKSTDNDAYRFLVEREQYFATRAEEEFRAAWTLYKTYTDDIVKQTKAMTRIVELHVSRLFHEVAVEKSVLLARAMDGKAEMLIRSMDGLSRMTLQLAGDTAAPLVLVRALINCSELSFLQGNSQLAFSAWCEAKSLLMLSYLHSESPISASQCPVAPDLKKSPGRAAFSSTASVNVTYDVVDAVNPLAIIPLPPIPFHPSLLERIYELLTRIVRLAFVIEPCPLLHNGSALLAAWTRLNHIVKSVVTPLFSTQNILSKSLESYSKIFDSSSKLSTSTEDCKFRRQHFFADTEEEGEDRSLSLKRASSLLKVLGVAVPGDPTNPSDRARNIRKSRSTGGIFQSISPLDDCLQAQLTKPTLLHRVSRRPRTVLHDSAFDRNIVYIIQDNDAVMERLAPRLYKPRSDKKLHGQLDDVTGKEGNGESASQSGGGSGESDNEVEEEAVTIVSATANIILPFEMIKKALSQDYGTEPSSPEGVRAVNRILEGVRESGKNALLDWNGFDAQHILARASCPGITMTSGGFFVEGVVDYHVAEERAHAYSGCQAQNQQEDLLGLLKHINSIYPNSSEGSSTGGSAPMTSSTNTTIGGAHAFLKSPAAAASPSASDSHRVNGFVSGYGDLVGAAQSKIRLQVLFLRLKVYNAQYTDGRMTLTEYYKKNMEAMKRIVYSQSSSFHGIGLSPSYDENEELPNDDHQPAVVRKPVAAGPLSPIYEMSSSSYGTSFDEYDSELTFRGSTAPSKAPPSDRLRSHSTDTRNALIHSHVPAAMYPPSFRFVVFINGTLLLFSPHENTVAVAVLRNSIRSFKPCMPCNSLLDKSNSTRTLSNISGDSDDYDGEGIDQSCTPLADRRYRSSLSRSLGDGPHSSKQLIGQSLKSDTFQIRKSGGTCEALSSAAGEGMRRYDSDDNLGDTRYVVNATGGVTSPNPPVCPLSDTTIMSALLDLPLACEDLAPDPASVLKKTSSRDKIVDLEPPSWTSNGECVMEAMRVLGLQRILFMLTVLILEEPLLIVISPGHEQALVHVCTALLRLLRPLSWQHLYIPLMHTSMQSVLGAVLRNREPFLIGAYHEMAGRMEEVMQWRSVLSDGCGCRNVRSSAKGSGDGLDVYRREHFANIVEDVNIFDMDTGAIKPGKRLHFAAACTISDTWGIVPEADPATLNEMLSRMSQSAEGQVSHIKPPIPARYRYRIFSKLSGILSPTDAHILYPPCRAGGSDIQRQSLVAACAEFECEMHSLMCSLFKGIKFHMQDPVLALSPTRHVLKKPSSSHSVAQLSLEKSVDLSEARNSLPEVEFLEFLKDDVRPFVQYLLHTRIFKRFLYDIYAFMKEVKYTDQDIALKLLPPKLSLFISITDKRMKRRQRFYSNMMSGRLAGYIITYFAKSIPEQEEQTYPFLYKFPYTQEAVKARMMDSHTFHLTKESLKVKRRWCVLDTQRLTYYKSRSKRLIKDYVTIDPSCVRLVSPPFCQPFPHTGGNMAHNSSPLSTDNNACALVYGSGTVLIFRAENPEEQANWVRALRARLSVNDSCNCAASRASIELAVNRFM